MNLSTPLINLIKRGRSKYLFEYLTIISCFLLFYLPNNFKLVFACSAILFFFMLYELKNLFLSLFLILFVSSLFISPGKFYSFVIIPAGKVQIEPYSSLGVIDGYGFIGADFAAIGMALYLLWWKMRVSGKSFHYYLKKYPNVTTILLSLFCFCIVGLYSSLFNSLFPTFSLINLIQYSKIIILFLSTFFLLKRYQDGQRWFENILAGALIFNFIVSIQQFFTQLSGIFHSSLNLNNSVQLDDQSLLPRIWGSFLHPNEFGLFMVLWFAVLVYLDRKRFLKWKWILAFTASIMLSQSRTVWLGMLICFVVFQFKFIFRAYLSLRKNAFGELKRYGVGVALAVTFFGVLLGPRILALRYTLDGGSGSIRLKMLDEGLQLLEDNPLFGYGVNSNVMVLWNKFPKGAVTEFPFSVHLGYLQLATEVGLLGTFFFFFPVFFLLWKLLKTRKAHSVWLLSGSLTFLAIYYIFQPHGGKLEIPLLGISFAYICHILIKRESEKTSLPA